MAQVDDLLEQMKRDLNAGTALAFRIKKPRKEER